MKKRLVFLLSLQIGIICTLCAQEKRVVGDDGYVYYEINTPNGKGIKNEMGDIVVPPRYKNIYFFNGFFEAYEPSQLNSWDHAKYGSLYDVEGHEIIPSSRQYDNIYASVKEGFKCILFRKGMLKDEYADNGACDANGKEIISPERGYDKILFGVNQGIPYFKVYKGKKTGICNAEGKEVIPPIYKDLYYYKKSFYDKNKDLAISVFDQAFYFDQQKISFRKEVDFPSSLAKNEHRGDDGFIWYEIKTDYLGALGAKDLHGNIIIPEEYHIWDYTKGFFVVTKDGFDGVYDKTGKCIIPTSRSYTSIRIEEDEEHIAFECIKKRNNESFAGVCDANGKELISPNRGYDRISLGIYQDIPYFVVHKGKKEGLCNASGKELLYPRYKDVRVFSTDGKIETDGISSGLSITQVDFNYDRKSISFGNENIQRENYLDRTDITKVLCTESVAGFKYYRFSKDGMCGALSTEGNLIVPPHYKFITFDDFSDALLAIRADGCQAMYTKGGQELIPASRGYTFIMRWDEDGYGGYYHVEKGKKNLGFCDANATEVISPDRGYTDISLSKYKSTWFIIVQRDGKFGACTINGKEIVAPIYEDLAIREDKGTFVGKTASGGATDLKVKPNGYRELEINYSAEDERKAQRRANRQRWLTAFAVGLAGAANAYANVVAQQAAIQNMSSYTPSMPANSYIGSSSSYYSSPAYLAQVQARADRTMANFQAQLQNIGQQALAKNQQMIDRSTSMFKDMIDWAFKFKSQNGREPTELEKAEWVKQTYPDMYSSFVQAQAAQYERSSNVSSSDNEPTESKKKISNTYDCGYCGGTGRLLQEDEVVSFGLSTEKEYKCQECGKWKYKGKTHRHYDCTHCNKGKATVK